MSSTVQIHGNEFKQFFPVTDSLTLQEITISTATIARSTRTIAGAAHIPCADYRFIASDKNVTGIIHEGDDTQFDREYFDYLARRIQLRYINVNVCFGHRITGYSAGSPNLTAATINVHLFRGNAEIPLIPNVRYASGLTALAANGDQLFVVSDSFPMGSQFEVELSDIFSFQLVSNETTGTATRQVGVVPLFPFQLANTSKFFAQSGIEVVGVLLD